MSPRKFLLPPSPVGLKIQITDNTYQVGDGDSVTQVNTGYDWSAKSSHTGFHPYPSSEVTSIPPSALSSVSVDAISIGSQDSAVELEPPSPAFAGHQIKHKRSMNSVRSVTSATGSLALRPRASEDAYGTSGANFQGLVVNPRDGQMARPSYEERPGARIPPYGTEIYTSESNNQWSRPVPASEFTIPHLPPPSPCQRLTSLPIWLVQRDLEFAAKKLMSPEVYRDFVGSAVSRRKFRDFLVKEGTVGALDCDWDGKVVEELAGQIRSASQGIYDAYIDRRASTVVNLPDDLRQQLLYSLRQLAVVDAGLSAAQKYLTDQLYTGAFQRYCKFRLIEASQVKLGNSHLANGMTTDGLGDCFCLTNPRLHDHPIVLCSDGFVAVTGYPREAILGRNCRFLQGPGTSPEAVRRIREGISSGDGCTELLLNYRLTGEPFWCLICIIPLRDAASNITYFIGGQVNVTSELASGSKLDFLIPGTTPDPFVSMTLSKPEILPSGAQIIYSPTLQQENAARNTQGFGIPQPHFLSEASGIPNSPGNASVQAEDVSEAAQSPGPKTRRFGWGQKEKRPANVVQQLLPGAEDVLSNSGFLPLHDQFGIAEATYSKVLVLNLVKREIIFITPQLLAFLGLPFASVKDKFDSKLLHTDLLDLITGDDKAHQKALRETAKNVIKSGKPGSIVMSFRIFSRQKMVGFRGAKESKKGILHLTPMKERGNKVVAYVALFGEAHGNNAFSKDI